MHLFYPKAYIHVSQNSAYKETFQITNNVTHHNDEKLQNKTIWLNELEKIFHLILEVLYLIQMTYFHLFLC